MGYLVKASFNSEPQAYSLEGIKDDVAAGSLTASALVRHEQQDFWYSVGELIGETPATEFQFDCPRCHEMNHAREIDVGLEAPCQKCGVMVKAPDILPPTPLTDPTPDLPLLRRGKRLLFWGAVIIIGKLLLMMVFFPKRIGIGLIDIVGICMMINGYGKRQLFYLKHPTYPTFFD
jgi:hypothetical protein